jgi:hypothetical protein
VAEAPGDGQWADGMHQKAISCDVMREERELRTLCCSFVLLQKIQKANFSMTE